MITLKQKAPNGDPLEAVFQPERGFNLMSFKRRDIEVIDQSTYSEFEKNSGGLGPIIGPHFGARYQPAIPRIKEEISLPHLSGKEADPLFHGIARYVPWQTQQFENKIIGTLSGKDTWENQTLAALEGQNFKMNYTVELSPKGLLIDLSVVSDTDSLVGIDFHYVLPEGKGTIISDVKDHYYDECTNYKKIPRDWEYSPEGMLKIDISNFSGSGNYAFHPLKDPLRGKIILQTPQYQLETRYSCTSQENSWEFYKPTNGSFVCINPLSSQNPWRPNLSVSSIHIEIEIKE